MDTPFGPTRTKTGKGKDDDHDQDFLSKDVRRIWSWSSENLLLRRRKTMTMTTIPSRRTWYAYGHGRLIFLFQRHTHTRTHPNPHTHTQIRPPHANLYELQAGMNPPKFAPLRGDIPAKNLQRRLQVQVGFWSSLIVLEDTARQMCNLRIDSSCYLPV